MKIAPQYRGDIIREVWRIRSQQPSDLGFAAQYGLDRKVFVMKPEYRFDHVRKRTVTNIMQQSGITIPMKDTNVDPRNREELVKIGGKGQVPCLVIDGKALYESNDIIEWLIIIVSNFLIFFFSLLSEVFLVIPLI